MTKKEFSRLTPIEKKGIVTQITNYPKPKEERKGKGEIIWKTK